MTNQIVLFSDWLPLCLTNSKPIPATLICLFCFTDHSVKVQKESKMLCAWLNCHISYSIFCSIFKHSHSPFMSVRQTFSFFPRDICFCQVHLHSLKSNISKIFSLFLLSCLPFFSSLECDDTLYHSRVFSIRLTGLKKKKKYLKGLEQVKKCGLNFNLGIKSKDHLRLNHSWRVPGAATQTLMRATWWQCVGFTNKCLFC